MLSHALSHNKLYKVEGWLLFMTVFSFISFFSNRLLFSVNFLYMEAKIFYTVRLMEYFIFFYIGALASQYFKNIKIVRAFFLWNFFIMILQKFNLIGAISSVGAYQENVAARVFGIASFPSEMGLILNLLFCYMVWDTSALSRFVNLFSSPVIRYILRRFYLYWMFGLCGIFVIFTGNRISIVALLVCFLFRLKNSFKLRSANSLIIIMVFIPLLFVGIGFLIKQSEGVYERSIDLFSTKNFYITPIWHNVDITKNLHDNETEPLENFDLSWWIRIHKWLFAAKSYLSNPACYLQGLGPGCTQAALDGGLLRILVENGLIGAFLYWQFFACLYRLNQQTKWMIISFLINMIFFDAYLAYKTMSLLFFICGHIFESQHRVYPSNSSSPHQMHLACQTV